MTLSKHHKVSWLSGSREQKQQDFQPVRRLHQSCGTDDPILRHAEMPVDGSGVIPWALSESRRMGVAKDAGGLSADGFEGSQRFD